MLAIYKKELKTYFNSPVAYVVIGLFIFLTSIFFLPNMQYQYGDFNSNLSTLGYILIFLIPILTMRLIAEDRKNGSEILLITSPVKLSSIVLGKYLAAFTVFLIMTVLTLIYPIILVSFGGLFTAQLVGGYIGFILLGACFLAVGIFVSSLTESQTVAAIVGIVSLLVMWLADVLADLVGGIGATVLNWFSVLSRYKDFEMGILSLEPVVYYLSFITVFLFATIMVTEKRRWSQG
ncbi:MAG: ABC transporter permease [Eubacteriales bacterium]|nr:ABC transporter permease [Eubacteriales bacterium]